MKYDNAKLVSGVSPLAAGAVYVDPQKTLNAKLQELTGGVIANGDQVQIGVVPAGMVLVPHLSLFQAPILDSNGAPTLTYKVGTDAVPDAVAAQKSGSTAQTLAGKDFTLTGVVGDPENDTPIYLTATAAAATLAAVGDIVFTPALRAWDTEVDG